MNGYVSNKRLYKNIFILANLVYTGGYYCDNGIQN